MTTISLTPASASGYTTVANVAALLGVTLTAGQQTHCAALIDRAEAAIDAYCNRSWQAGEQEDEAHYNPRHNLYLRYPPVTEVASVTARVGLGDDEETLVGGEDYEVRSLATGHIWLACPYRWGRVQVTYTPTDEPPPLVTQAATELVALWLQPVLQPGSYGVESYKLPDLEVKFSRVMQQGGGMPPAIRILLDPLVFIPVA